MEKDVAKKLEEHEEALNRLNLALDRFNMNLGRSPLFRGSTFEVSDYHIASWTPGSTLPLTDSSKYVRMRNGSLEIRGGALDISTAADGARMEMTGDYLKTWDASDGLTFYLDFTTGDLLMSGVFYVPGKYLFNEDGIFIETAASGGTYLTFVEDVDSNPLGEMSASIYQYSVPGDSLTVLDIQSVATTTLTHSYARLIASETDNYVALSLDSETQTFAITVNTATSGTMLFSCTPTGVHLGAASKTNTIEGATAFNDTSADVDFRVESDDNANMLFVDGGEDRVGIGTGTPGEKLDVAGNIEHHGYVRKYHTANIGSLSTSFYKATISNNTATAVFTITTPNVPDSDTDAGGYSCFIRTHAQNAAGAGAGYLAAMSNEAMFNRSIMDTGGTGVTSAVTQTSSASSATNAAVRDISSVTISVVEVNEYQVEVKVTVVATGSAILNNFCVMSVDFNWYGFASQPVLAAA